MTAWIVETLVATTILMVLVLLVRGHAARMFGARIAYLLWLLPALRMVLPPLPEAVVPMPIAHLPVVVDFSMIEAVEAAPLTAESGIAWGIVLLAIWLTGALCYCGWHIIAYRRFVGNALARATQLPEFDRAGIEVCASAAVDGPFATGVFTPRIVLPHDYRHRYSAEELRLALTHERAHHRRGDLSFNYLALGMLSLHWFNPVAHRAWRAFRADQELACDAIVLAGATPEERHSYGSALVKSACRRTPVAACALNPRNQLKLRLKMMRDARERTLVGRGLATLLVGGGLALTASGGIAAETTREMEDTMRNAVVERTAMLHDVVEPTMSGRTPSRPPRAPDAPDAPMAPEFPAPPAPPVAPAPPAPPVPPADAEAWNEWRKDVEEARREAHDAQREAWAAHREAMRAWSRAYPIVRVSPVQCEGKDDGRSHVETSTTMVDGKERKVQVVRVCIPRIDMADIRATQIKALSAARAGLERSRHLNEQQLEHALESIDTQLDKLEREDAD